MKNIIVLMLCLLAGCGQMPIKNNETENIITIDNGPLKAYKNPAFDYRNYDDVEDYVINDKKHLAEFLEKYWEKLSLPKKTSKLSLVKKFENRIVRRNFVNNMSDAIYAFNELGLEEFTGDQFSYYFANRNAEKTLIYIHGNISPVGYWMEFANSMVDHFKDINIVFVYSSKFNNEEKVYTAKELNDLFASDTENFFKAKNIKADKAFFNVIGHSSLITHGYFDKNENGYSKVIFYSPMIKKASSDNILNYRKIFPPDTKFVDYYTTYYLYSLKTKKGTRAFSVPKINLNYNLATEMNLMDQYFEGLNLSRIKRKALIYAEKEDMFAKESFGIAQFDKENIVELKGMQHHHYFSILDQFPYYFEKLDKLMKD